jgi:uncharacterized membrane protein
VERPQRSAFAALAACALAGVVFSGISTFDFAAHLDRQVHAITCSYIPGLGAADASGSSGCYAALMSPYSSVFRALTWGGIPISLPAMAVFAYLLFCGADIWFRRAEHDPGETRFLVAATALPLLVSAVYFVISVKLVGTLCKLCVGVYASSTGVFAAALWAHWAGKGSPRKTPGQGLPWGRYSIVLVEGVLFVCMPVLLYLALKPAYSAPLGRCGELRHPEDRYGVRVRLTDPPGGVPALEVLDPLCPACKHFSQRLEASGLIKRLQLSAVMFPLDKECNWMVPQTLHPGACGVSEALLCAGERLPQVLEWAFAHQEELRALAAQGNARLYERLRKEFPALAPCLGKPAVRARLNQSLRWAVANSLPVLTPQLYVGNQRLCDEDTDLGLEYALTRALDERSSLATGARK